MNDEKMKKIRETVKAAYGSIAEAGGRDHGSSCGCGLSDEIAQQIGYTRDDIDAVPEGANLGLGCGNPTAIASLRPGETVLDLGSGAGFDCFLAADRVGPGGRVIGVDMTPEMLERARANAQVGGYDNVEFRQGEIEQLPVEDASVDAIISNCVINLSADKPRVFRELARVLRPGGRIAISDIVLRRELPEALSRSVEAYVGCVAGALRLEEYGPLLAEAGLHDIDVLAKDSLCIDPETLDPLARKVLGTLPAGETIDSYVASAYITATRPSARCCG